MAEVQVVGSGPGGDERRGCRHRPFVEHGGLGADDHLAATTDRDLAAIFEPEDLVGVASRAAAPRSAAETARPRSGSRRGSCRSPSRAGTRAASSVGGRLSSSSSETANALDTVGSQPEMIADQVVPDGDVVQAARIGLGAKQPASAHRRGLPARTAARPCARCHHVIDVRAHVCSVTHSRPVHCWVVEGVEEDVLEDRARPAGQRSRLRRPDAETARDQVLGDRLGEAPYDVDLLGRRATRDLASPRASSPIAPRSSGRNAALIAAWSCS